MNERRIPIYVAIDCGANMHSHHAKLVDVMDAFISCSRNDPSALESMWMSFVAVGNHCEIAKPLLPLVEFHGIKVKPITDRSDTSKFEEEMVRLFNAELVRQRTETSKPDYCPRIFWVSDGSHHEFVKRCSNPYHWKRLGYLSWFTEIDCSVEEIVPIVSQSSFWICNPYDDELLPDEEELIEMQSRLFLPPNRSND